jgi:hypothetical protein
MTARSAQITTGRWMRNELMPKRSRRPVNLRVRSLMVPMKMCGESRISSTVSSKPVCSRMRSARRLASALRTV